MQRIKKIQKVQASSMETLANNKYYLKIMLWELEKQFMVFSNQENTQVMALKTEYFMAFLALGDSIMGKSPITWFRLELT